MELITTVSKKCAAKMGTTSKRDLVMLNIRALCLVLVALASHSVYGGTELYFVHNDHLGTAKVITNQDQDVVWRGEYSPFGEVEETSDQIEFRQRFPGQYSDDESGYFYNYYRDYEPALGRYIQSDPIGLNGGLNTYGYVEGNPVKYVDINGLIKNGHPGTATDAYRSRAQSSGAKIFSYLSYALGLSTLGGESSQIIKGGAGPLGLGAAATATFSLLLDTTNSEPDGDNDNDGIPDTADSDDDNDGYPDDSDKQPLIWDPPPPPGDDEKDCPPSSWSSPPPTPCTWDFSVSPAKLKCPPGYSW